MVKNKKQLICNAKYIDKLNNKTMIKLGMIMTNL